MSKPVTRRPNHELTGKQRSFLRGLAHHLDPLVNVGKEGLTDGLFSAVSEVLRVHELVKVKVLEGAPLPRDEAAEAIAKACGAHVVGEVGRIAILYRMHEEKPTIVLPKR